MEKAKKNESKMYDFSVLRSLRKRENYTLEDVSEKSGISIAVISKLERNQTSAELETIFKLGRVFGMTASDLIALAESPLCHRKSSDSYDSDGYNFEKVSYTNHALLLGNAKKGAKVSRPEVHQDDYETCWVLEGVVRISMTHETIELSAGESVQFDAIQEHAYEALEDCKIIIAHLRKENRF